MSPNEVGVEITEYLMPFISALLILVITLWFKDFATKIAKGIQHGPPSHFVALLPSP